MEERKKQIVTINNNEHLLTIKWRITSWCNYRCSYCIQKKKNKDEKTDFLFLLKIAKEVNRLIDSSSRPVKLYLIGGEVTWYNLEQLISVISSNNLAKIAITTNLSNSLEYYLSLANYLRSRGITLGLCCSLHKEYVEPEAFIKKVAAIKEEAGIKNIKVEYVVNPQTEALVNEIQNLCEKAGLNYRFDYDKTLDDFYRSKGLNVAKDNNSRYIITFDDGSVDTSLSQNQLLNYQNGQTKDSKFNSEGFYCTRGMSYVDIDVDKAADHGGCTSRDSFVPISEYRIKTEPQLCPMKYCSLCGDISLAKRKEDIDF